MTDVTTAHRAAATSIRTVEGMFTTIFPILTTSRLQRMLGFYRDLLGAKVSYEFPGPDGEPGYVGLELGGAALEQAFLELTTEEPR